MDEKLKPCPFCGSKAKISSSAYVYFVRCSNLECEAYLANGKMDKDGAIKEWNTRSSPEAAMPNYNNSTFMAMAEESDMQEQQGLDKHIIKNIILDELDHKDTYKDLGIEPNQSTKNCFIAIASLSAAAIYERFGSPATKSPSVEEIAKAICDKSRDPNCQELDEILPHEALIIAQAIKRLLEGGA